MLRSASPRLSSVLTSFGSAFQLVGVIRHAMGLVALLVIGVAALTVDGDAAARPQPHGFRVVGNRAIVLAEIELRAAADKMGDRQVVIETNRLFRVGQSAIIFMAHGP